MDFLEKYNLSWEVVQTYLIEYGTNVIFAILIFFIGKWLANLFTSLIRKSLKRANLDDMLVSFIGNIAYAVLLAFVIIASLSELGVETTSIAAALAAAGLAIGLALQGSLSNFAAGIMIIAFRPFRIGDYIEAAGTAGSVKEINIFTTTLQTPDNKRIIVPNNSVTSSNICNYSANPTRRLDMVFGCGYDDDIKLAKSTIERIITASKYVLKDPAPLVAVSELGANSVDFVARPWVKSEDYWTAKFELIEQIKQAFDEEGLSIPYPQRDVHIHEVKEKAKPKKKAASTGKSAAKTTKKASAKKSTAKKSATKKRTTKKATPPAEDV